MEFKVEAHEVKRLNANSVAIFIAPELKTVQFWLISVQITPSAGFLRLENLVAEVRCLPTDVDIPQLHGQVKPEIQRIGQ